MVYPPDQTAIDKDNMFSSVANCHMPHFISVNNKEEQFILSINSAILANVYLQFDKILVRFQLSRIKTTVLDSGNVKRSLIDLSFKKWFLIRVFAFLILCVASYKISPLLPLRCER